MKKGGIVVLFFILTFTNIKSLYANEFSLGIAAISPTGLSAKFWLSDKHAIDLFGSWSFSSDKFNFHSDYLIHNFNLLKVDENPMAFYYGVGARIKDEEEEDLIIGVRMPFGITYLMSKVPVDVFGEVAPRVNIVPSTNFGLDVMIGIRYRFFPNDHKQESSQNQYQDSGQDYNQDYNQYRSQDFQ
jgi:hypothetical protein